MKNICVMIVDDDCTLRNELVTLMRGKYKEVTEFKSALQALEQIESINPHIILSDQYMDELNGIDFLRKVRARGVNIPFILLSGLGDKHLVTQALKLGVSDFLDKPFDQKMLFDSIERIFEIQKREKIKAVNEHQANSSEDLKRNNKILGLLRVVHSSKGLQD